MDGFLFVVEPDSSRVVSGRISLRNCRTQTEVQIFRRKLEEKVGESFVVLDSRTAKDWNVPGPQSEDREDYS
ncbi:hypothetical protein KUW15_13175 [Qipengyuania aquimaris]|uniref:hypothetical protein n=1 Tax=Qipengyuania aquimaris TaxID=255984 RepID=UPI001C97FF7B|nr:hypothetical protein [Qipengyuania aquimaris]MBY6129667.1 hypothetical protein [Qipengyuania aquimaris]